MLGNIKVLLGTDHGNVGTLCAAKLRQGNAPYETQVIHREAAEILSWIHHHRPNVMVLEMNTAMINACGLMEVVRYLPGYHPRFIVLNESGNWAIKEKVLAAGASFYFPEPIPVDFLCQCIEELAHASPSTASTAASQPLDQLASTLLLELKVSPSHKGYHYLRMALLAVYADPTIMHAVTKRLYPHIANRFDSNVLSVERAIRNAIASAWELMDQEMKHRYFSGTQKKPTNTRYIASVLELLRAKDALQSQPSEYPPVLWKQG